MPQLNSFIHQQRRTRASCAVVLVLTTFAISSVGAFTSTPASSAPRFLDSGTIYFPESTSLHAHGQTSSLNYSNGDDAVPIAPDIMTNSKPPKTMPNGGKITLVGAGPGSPDLLTVAAHRTITDPNALVIVDRLVSKEIVDIITGEVRIAKKYPGCQAQAQEEIFEWCKEGLNEGRHVVRLKIGDPFVFGRGGEEVLEFRSFGVEPSVIPGVSAAFSAPLLASIPVTHRGISNQVVMCTGYGRDNTSPDLIQYHKEQTVVFLMAVGRLRELCHNLVTKAGYPIKTPVGIVERAGCPDQRTVVGNMETIADLAEKYNVKPPSTIIVGDVVNVLLTKEDFFEETLAQKQGLVQSLV